VSGYGLGMRTHVTAHQSRAALARWIAVLVMLCGASLLGGCAADTNGEGVAGPVAGGEESSGPPSIAVAQVGSFQQPLHAAAVPGTDLVAVVEKGGRVFVVSGMSCQGAERCPEEPVQGGEVVVDLSNAVSTGSEQGLLGLAFHPQWPRDERIFLNYTDRDGTTRVEAWNLAGPTARAQRHQELLRIRQPYANHNGGHLAFGPDGLLYVGTGDGGAAGDPEDRAQEDDELLGKMLRLDVDAGGARGYAIPDGNLDAGAEQVWAVGLRNPWRYSFDSELGDLWIADVGQNAWEALHVLPASRLQRGPAPNFGWRLFEGYEPFDQDGRTGAGKLVRPVLAYGHDDGCSITGGVVYRGELVEQLRGWYVFADFCGDDLRLVDADGVPGGSFEPGELQWTSAAQVAQVASIVEVHQGELLVVSLGGAIGQVVPG
jgi:glucose/arabinose dehydrogenase